MRCPRDLIATAALCALALAAAAAAAQSPSALPAAAPCGVVCGDDRPAWSPDGNTIAFVRYVRGATGPRQTIYRVPARGGAARSVVALEATYPRTLNGPLGPLFDLRWSPDSSTLAFSGRTHATWVVSASGGLTRRLGGRRPTWSPDGRQIAYERPTSVPHFRTDTLYPAEVLTAAANESMPRVLAGSEASGFGGRWAASPLWSPNNRIAYVTGERHPGTRDANYATTEIWSVRPDGTNARRLVTAGSAQGYSLLGWTPDGRRLFFLASSGEEEVVESVTETGERTRVYGIGPREVCCWLSPDGARLALFRPTHERRFDLSVVELAGGTNWRLVRDVGGRATNAIAWSPGGDRLAFVDDGECRRLFGVHIVSVGGTDVRRLTNGCRRSGTSGRDVIRGRAGPDALYGRGGADRLDGVGGGDFLQGGRGDDVVHGGLGDDRVYGGPGRDRLYGGAGSDTIVSRDGRPDTVLCGTGRDDVEADRRDAVARDCERVTRA